MEKVSQKTYICLHTEDAYDLPELIKKAESWSYSAVAVPLVNPLYYREFNKEPMKSKHAIFSRSDLLLKANDWYLKVISVLNDQVDCDSEDVNIRRHSELTLMQELSFAEHIVQHGYNMITLKSSNCVNLARITTRSIKGTLIVAVPMSDPIIQKKTWRKNKTEDEIVGEDTWHWWNKFRTVSDYNSKLRVALTLSEDIPSNDEIYRWLGEPVEFIIISSELFLHNKANYPVLSQSHQQVLSYFIRHNVHFILQVRLSDGSIGLYVEYMKYLIEKFNVVDQFQTFQDVLQIPLQPLYDNLDSYTYEIFEKDPVKYKLYQDAIELALIDKVPESEKETKTMVVMILGAGRGPLVRSTLNASVNTGRKIKIYIVEKNPHAIITLNALINEMWSDKDIQLFSKDMRDFEPKEKADILVSELLGSFGDNELSPECLDGAQKYLKDDGISIPCKSTSYINPIMSPKLYDSTRQIYLPDRNSMPCGGSLSSLINQNDNMYVVYLKSVYHIDKPKPLFEFEYPNKSEVIDNSRFKTIQFEIKNDCVLHGFGGYFDTILYKNISFSINPENHTNGLFSWFPMYIPISIPCELKVGDILEVNFWRCVEPNRKVWYEWNITKPLKTRIHNHYGRTCVIHM